MKGAGRIKVFYSYAHEDEAYVEAIKNSLQPLRAAGKIYEWYDRDIRPGQNWNRTIDQHLEDSKIVLFLVSPDFIASDYIIGVEVKRAIELHWQRLTHIVPIVVRPTDWSRTQLASFQGLPKDAEAISLWKNQAAAYSDIYAGVDRVCKEIVDWENPYRRARVGDWTELQQTQYIKPNQQTIDIKIYLEVVKKTDDYVVVATQGTADGVPHEIPDIRVPLDIPLEDDMARLLKQVDSPIPPDAEIGRQELGKGEEKLFIGGTPYYTSWIRSQLQLRHEGEVLNQRVTTWRSIDVPMDGVVKTESDSQVLSWRSILVGHGHGTGKPTGQIKRRRREARAAKPKPLPTGISEFEASELYGRANLAMILAYVSIFMPVVAPFAFFMGFGVNRRLKRGGYPTSGAATTGIVLGGLISLVGAAAIVLLGGFLMSVL